MAGITGQGTTFNLPNYVGEIFALTPADTPFLSMIGGLTGGKRTAAKSFTWQGFDLRAAAVNTKVEGATPTGQARVRTEFSNVVEIHQDAVEVNYSKQAAINQNNGTFGVNGTNPVADEMAWQTEQSLKQTARDVNYSFINGTYQLPVNNATPRKTRGILAAITTNVVLAAGASPTKKMILDLMQAIWDSGGITESETATIMVNLSMKRWISKLFITDANYAEASRNIGGVNVLTIETDFGKLNVMLDRAMPTTVIAVVSAQYCFPVFMEIPGKGFFFQEPLAKVGAADKSQTYGEVGLEYGSEIFHGKITGLDPAAPGS